MTFYCKNTFNHILVVLQLNGAARDTDNNKLHNEKTPQPTKGQRYNRLTEENISNIAEGKKSLG
jgi:hypothetical protein